MKELAVCDYDRLADNYDRSRNVTEFYAKHWISKLIEHGRLTENQKVLDIGCGTGRYTQCLKNSISSTVIGIDPSRKMLNKAELKLAGEADGFIQTRCEQLPFSPRSFNFAFMFFVVHHIPASFRPDAYSEVRNVLKAGGRFIIVTRSHEQIKNSLVGLFPGVIEIDCGRMPDIDLLKEDLKTAGFAGVKHLDVPHFTSTRDRTDFIIKVKSKFISTLTMFDGDFDERFKTFTERLHERFGDAEELPDPMEFTFIIAETG
jgi:SAM-dependent methyltransferase